MTPREPYATSKEVCDFLRIAPQTLYNWRTRGSGPVARKIGGQLRFLWCDVEAFADGG